MAGVAGRLINLGARYGPKVLKQFKAGKFRKRKGFVFASEELVEPGEGLLGYLAGGTVAGVGAGYGIGVAATKLAERERKRQKVLEELYAQDVGSSTKLKRRIDQAGGVRVRRKINLNMPADRAIAGNSSVKQRVTTKRKLKSGRVGRKLQKLNDEIIYRWQRIYPYGQNDIAYPSGITQNTNPTGGGRLQLSHFTTTSGENQINHLPVYLFDLTSWTTLDSNGSNRPKVCQRLEIGGTNNPRWQDVYTQNQGHAVITSEWKMERSNLGDPLTTPPTSPYPTKDIKKAMLKWSDMRFCFYGARQHPTRIIIELVQFKDEKYTMNFHEDGEPFNNMPVADQNDVRGFWLEEVKKLVYHPLDVQNFNRKQAITSLYRESFQIAPDDTTNADICPPNVVKRIFKRFNRLVNWDWETPVVTETTGVEAQKNELETPAFQVGYSSNTRPYANPKARIYLYIRAEDMDPVGSTDALHVPAVPVPTLANQHQGDAFYDEVTGWNIPAVPSGTTVCGYDYVTRTAALNTSVAEATGSSLLPRYCKNDAVPAQWSTTTTPSFDVMIRQKWVLQK